MFCPNCGAEGQTAESYCRFCGEWLPDIDALADRRLFGKLSREQKINKMRVLQVVSAGLSVTSAAIILSVLAGGDVKILFLAALCSIVVAAYQIVNLYLGYKVHQRTDQRRTDNAESRAATIAEKPLNTLNAADTTDFVNVSSVTENTTKNLEPVTREKTR